MVCTHSLQGCYPHSFLKIFIFEDAEPAIKMVENFDPGDYHRRCYFVFQK